MIVFRCRRYLEVKDDNLGAGLLVLLERLECDVLRGPTAPNLATTSRMTSR